MPYSVQNLFIIIFFKVTIASKFDIQSYESGRLIVELGQNATTFLIRSKTESDANKTFGQYFKQCNNTQTGFSVKNYCTGGSTRCSQLNADNKKNTTIDKDQYFQFVMDKCSCYITDCSENANKTKTVLYPGCSCSKSEKCDSDHYCDEWTRTSNDPDMPFEVFLGRNTTPFLQFSQAGTIDFVLNKSIATIMSPIYKQSGLLCSLRFSHHFTPQSTSSRISVKAHFENGETMEIWQKSKQLLESLPIWEHENVIIGSFSRPFQLSINCDSGPYPPDPQLIRSYFNFFICAISQIELSNCDNDENLENTCLGPSSSLCAVNGNLKCLKNVECDFTQDCSDGSDEINCDRGLYGTRCAFDDVSKLCDGWEQHTRTYNGQEFHSLLPEPDIPPDGKPKHLFSIRQPKFKQGITTEARHNSGSFLSYQHSVRYDRIYTDRTTAFVSPVFPPTNPLVYNESDPLYLTCRLRFRACSSLLFNWEFSIIAKGVSPFLSGKLNIYSFKLDSRQMYKRKKRCEWVKESVIIPRQNNEFRIALFVNHHIIKNRFFAIDDLSISSNCFDENYSNETYYAPDVYISSANAQGSEKPNTYQFQKQRFFDGQTAHFLNKDGTQDWFVPSTGFYRIEACGAGGGGTVTETGLHGTCALTQTHLLANMFLRTLVGQMGEHACFKYDKNAKSSCHSYKNSIKRNGGGGGGGATLINVEMDHFESIIAGGGGGANAQISHNKLNVTGILAGYGAAGTDIERIPECKEVCKLVTPLSFNSIKENSTCPSNYTTVFGGFGGGGNSCGSLGGGGAGYKPGKPKGMSSERSGSSFVLSSFSKQAIYFQSKSISNGYIKIDYCRKTCEHPSVCRFRGENLEEQYCGCPDGSEYTNDSNDCSCSLSCPYESRCLHRNFTFEPFCLCENGDEVDELHPICETIDSRLAWIPYFLVCFVSVTLFSSFSAVCYYKRMTKKIVREMKETHLMELAQICLYDANHFGNKTRENAIKELPNFPRSTMTVGRKLGIGQGGQVYFGTFDMNGRRTVSAVKLIYQKLSFNEIIQADFTNEALCLHTFDHENIIKLIGVDFDLQPYVIAAEFMDGGDLLSFLKEARPHGEKINPLKLTILDLVKLVQEVAAGCTCLEQNGYIHRDIAARNILLTTKGSGRKAKIGDFGMAKHFKHSSEYYRTSGEMFLPLKWSAPEGFIDGMFTAKSDVWGFGILCFEVFSLGVVPYSSMSNEEVMLHVANGGRSDYPFGIPLRMYQLMRKCWKTLPDERPTFVKVCEELEEIVEDREVRKMPFPVHPTISNKFSKCSPSPHSSVCETPQTALTELSTATTFSPQPAGMRPDLYSEEYRTKIRELLLEMELPYTSEMSEYVLEDIRDYMASQQKDNAIEIRNVFQPSEPIYNNQDEPNETSRLIEPICSVENQTPSPSGGSSLDLAVQDTGPGLNRPSLLNIHSTSLSDLSVKLLDSE